MFAKMTTWEAEVSISGSTEVYRPEIRDWLYIGEATSVVVEFRVLSQSGAAPDAKLYTALSRESEALVEVASATWTSGDTVLTLEASVANGDVLGAYLAFSFGTTTTWSADFRVKALIRL